ncbi:hypothetical protein [Psychrobacter sp. DM4]|uniref:hypothetical protein n=1 Tax=Psychrobacter sp. DM4 TaxID=3440637 RepID=UPI003F50302B
MSKQPMWNTPLQTFMVTIMMAAGLSLSACNSSEPEVSETNTLDNSEEQVVADASDSASTDLDGAVSDQGTPVVYEVSTWNTDAVTSLKINDLKAITTTLGSVVTTDENSLDYASNPASKYRLMAADQPYLDLIDSDKYLELGWYYANPTDSDAEKELSLNHAKKSNTVMRQLMGDDGSKLLANILSGQIIKNETIGGQKVELAKCEFYSCMLILNKSGA